MRVLFQLMLLAVLSLSATAAWSLPDLARGKAALERGDLIVAEENLLPLAERGFVEAQIYLGRMYSDAGTPESMEKAQQWYRRAMEAEPEVRVSLARLLLQSPEQSDPREIETLLIEAGRNDHADALPLRVRLYRSYPEQFSTSEAAEFAQRAGDSKRAEDRAEAISWYRVHADVPAYAQALAALCEQDKDLQEDCLSDLAQHYRTQNQEEALLELKQEISQRYEAGQISNDALERFARVLAAEDFPGQVDAEGAFEMFSAIPAPSPDTRARLAKLLIAHPELDPDRNPDALLQEAFEAGSYEAAMLLGRRFLKANHPKANPERAQELLSEAAQHVPAAHYFLGRYYERGYQGPPEASRALDHYLNAARQGYARADLALSKMYWNNRGIRVDPVNAYVFARIATHYQVEGAAELLGEVQQGMSAQELAQAQAKAEREYDARRNETPVMTTAQIEKRETR